MADAGDAAMVGTIADSIADSIVADPDGTATQVSQNGKPGVLSIYLNYFGRIILHF